MKRLGSTLALGLLLVPALTGAVTPTWNEIEWFEDAAGYAEAVSQAEATGDPVLVYFYTHWCPYCRQLNKGLLGDPAVQAVTEVL